MRGRFVDSSYYLALLNQNDEDHLSASILSQERGWKLLTTEYVIIEVANWLSSTGDRRLFEPFLIYLRSNPDTHILPAQNELFETGVSLYVSRPDKDWSLTDCISFVVMERHGLTEALTADHHFAQAGFKVLL